MAHTVLDMRKKNWDAANTAFDDANRAYLTAMDPDADPSTWPDREAMMRLWNARIVAKRVEAEAYEIYRVTREFVEANQARAEVILSSN